MARNQSWTFGWQSKDWIADVQDFDVPDADEPVSSHYRTIDDLLDEIEEEQIEADHA